MLHQPEADDDLADKPYLTSHKIAAGGALSQTLICFSSKIIKFRVKSRYAEVMI